MSEQFELTTHDLTTYEFEGERIGHASTEHDDSLRWTEVLIFKTSSGRYVVQRLGRSIVYHLLDSSCSSNGDEISGSEISEESEPCDKCNPPVPEAEGFDPEQRFRHEVTISRVDVVDEPSQIRDVLMVVKPHREPFLSSVAFSAIQDAVRHDPALIGVFERKVRLD